MFNDAEIHWMHCIGNYIQFVALIFPLPLFLICSLLKINNIVFKIFHVYAYIFVIWCLIISIFTLYLCFICKKIKKNNPKYSKCELKDW